MLVQNIQKINTERVLKVMLVMCVILALSLSWFAPQANAVAGTIALVAGEAVTAEIISAVIGALVMAATGVGFECGFFGDTDNLSTMAYEQGYELIRDLSLFGGAPSAWLDEVVGLYTLSGGFSAGDTIEVPADVLEYTRIWVNENYDFTEGNYIINDYGILADDGTFFEFTTGVSIPYSGYIDVSQLGTVIPCDVVFEAQVTDLATLAENAQLIVNDKAICLYSYSDGNKTYYRLYMNSTQICAHSINPTLQPDFYCTAVLVYNPANGMVYPATVDSDGWFTHTLNRGFSPTAFTSENVITGSDALDVPQTENKVIQVPDVPMGSVGGYSVPAVQQLTQDMVISDTVVTPDVVVPDTDAFSVPDTWSGFDAWIKNQAKTITDFTSLIQQKVTGIATDVADFGVSVKEWINEKWGTFSDFVLTIPDIIALKLEGILADVLEVVNKPVQSLKDKFNETKNKLLPFIQNGFGFPNIWHYVVSWVGSLGSWLRTMFTVWNGLPYEMVVPIYATAVIVIVIGMYRRFFM